MSNLILFDRIIGFLIPFESILFGIILFLLHKDNKSNKSKRVLACYMFLNALTYLYLFLYYSGFYNITINFYYIATPAVAIIQPYFYFYLKTLTNQKFKLNKKKLVHFSLAIILLLFNIIFYTQLNYQEKINLMALKVQSGALSNFFLHLHLKYFRIIFTLQALVYLVLNIKLIYNYRKTLPGNFSNFEDVKLNWLIVLFLVYFIGISIQESLGFIDNLFYDESARIYYNLLIMIVIAFIGVQGIRQKEIFSEITEEEMIVNEIETDKKYKASYLSDDKKTELSLKLKMLIETEKPFLNNELRLDHIAKKLNTNRQYLSEVINDTYNKNFYTFINEYRIDEAKKMLSNKEYKHLTIIAIAKSVGFNSKSTFNTLFKKYTGKTPSQYMKEIYSE